MLEGTFKIKQSGKEHADMASSTAPTREHCAEGEGINCRGVTGQHWEVRRVSSQNCLSNFPKTPFSSSH